MIKSAAAPEKMKDAMGRLGLLSPTRARRMARAMATTASSCPITRLCSVSSIFTSLSLSSLDTCAKDTIPASLTRPEEQPYKCIYCFCNNDVCDGMPKAREKRRRQLSKTL